ncbi:DUF2339 domain-containing protein [Paenibacillus macerans]|uniref:DUF2339 domain-containing protein n=1 Tax=Paenibacillus macerans TaxID=44252 RepID=UPI00203E2FCF|nr:DUF2339 domain-containing protein [Paenibacillus macerans]MCM3703660.1 DUF2339 domain-containing protein [Paenibacillus macerans]
MKEFRDRLVQLQEDQARMLKEYQALIAEYESYDYIRENETLRRQYEELKQRADALEEQLGRLDHENRELRQALSEQMLDEKLGLLDLSRKKLYTYFSEKVIGQGNRLESLETFAKQRIDHLIHQTDRQLDSDREGIKARLQQFHEELEQRMAEHRKRLLVEEHHIRQETWAGYEKLAAEGVDEETMQRRQKQNRIEMKIGLNWINKIGILLIILGVGAAFKYSYTTWFSGYMKGLAFFLLGALMIAGGEWLFRKRKKIFALGLLGGGISVLYGSVFYSYFLLHIISLYAGFAVCVLITAAAVFLSLRYRSRTICSLGLIGGYLPLLSYISAFGLEGGAVYAAMGYLLLLNGLILLVSFRKRWPAVTYISFLLHTPSMIALAALAEQAWIAMLYTVCLFLLYLGITLRIPFKSKWKLSWWDFSLLALNTIVSCGTMYGLIAKAELTEFRGLLALLFCLIYTALGRFAQKKLAQEKAARILFYATALTFAVLMIPFQLDVRWVTMGWLVEGMALAVFAGRSRLKPLERAGWGIVLLCAAAFFWVDFIRYLFGVVRPGDFNLQYSSVSLGPLLLMLYYALRFRNPEENRRYLAWEHSFISWVKYVSLSNLWLYLVYEAGFVYDRLVPVSMSHGELYKWLLIAAVTMVLAYALTKFALLYDKFVKIYTLVLYSLSYFISFIVTLALPALQEDAARNGAAEYVALIVLIAFNIVVFFSGKDVLFAAVRRDFRSTEWYPVIMGAYLFAVLTAFLAVQFQLGDAGLWFSLVYLLLAIGYIVYGFRYRYVYIRRVGLGLTLLSTGKMLLYDLSLLTTGSKILAFFAFGVVLLAISYIYQRISLRLEGAKEEGVAEETAVSNSAE